MESTQCPRIGNPVSLGSCPAESALSHSNVMANPDQHPVTAVFLGIPSALGRFVVVWLTVSLFLGIPFIPVLGWEVLKNSFLWPVACIYGIVEWGGLPPPWTIGAALLPAGMILGAWGYVMDVAPALSLWMVAHCSLMLTGPTLFSNNVAGWVLWIIGILWGLVSLGWYRIARGSAGGH